MYDIICLTTAEVVTEKNIYGKVGVESEENEYHVCDPYDCNPDVFD